MNATNYKIVELITTALETLEKTTETTSVIMVEQSEIKQPTSIITDPEKHGIGFESCIQDIEGEYHNVRTTIQEALTETREVLACNYGGWGCRYVRILQDLVQVLQNEIDTELKDNPWTTREIAEALNPDPS